MASARRYSAGTPSADRRPRAGADTDTQELMPRGFVPYQSGATGSGVTGQIGHGDVNDDGRGTALLMRV